MIEGLYKIYTARGPVSMAVMKVNLRHDTYQDVISHQYHTKSYTSSTALQYSYEPHISRQARKAVKLLAEHILYIAGFFYKTIRTYNFRPRPGVGRYRPRLRISLRVQTQLCS